MVAKTEQTDIPSRTCRSLSFSFAGVLCLSYSVPISLFLERMVLSCLLLSKLCFMLSLISSAILLPILSLMVGVKLF